MRGKINARYRDFPKNTQVRRTGSNYYKGNVIQRKFEWTILMRMNEENTHGIEKSAGKVCFRVLQSMF